jgi:hypothetical protein
MTLKFNIQTEKPVEMVEALEKFDEGIKEKGQSQVFSNWKQLKAKEFMLEIVYPLENRLANWVIEKELRNTLKKLDSEIKIKKV